MRHLSILISNTICGLDQVSQAKLQFYDTLM